MLNKSINKLVVVFILSALNLLGSELKVSSLNCYLYFKPGNSAVGGQLTEKGPPDIKVYNQKTANLSSLINDQDVVAVQEIGSEVELNDLGSVAKMQTAYTQGKDTYTGEDVGVLYRLPPGWKISGHGRVPSLDRILSKHLQVTFVSPEGKKVVLLNVHLIRPIGQNAGKHQDQVQAISNWAANVVKSGTSVIVIGDTNNTIKGPIFGGLESGGSLGWTSTLNGSRNFPIDRVALWGSLSFKNVNVRKPPYGDRPNDLNKMLWTDHSAVVTTISVN